MRRKCFKNDWYKKNYMLQEKQREHSKISFYKAYTSIQIPLLMYNDHTRIEILQLTGNDCE